MVETTIPFKTHAFYEISQHRYVIARILEGKRMRRRPSETRRTVQKPKRCTALCTRLLKHKRYNVVTATEAPQCGGILCARRKRLQNLYTLLAKAYAGAESVCCMKMPLCT